VTQVIKSNGDVGVKVWEETPAEGPFGFNEALLVDGKTCVVDSKFRLRSDNCMQNPAKCNEGLSIAIWEKVTHPRKLIDLDPDTGDFEKKYIFSTGADYDYDLKKSVPGVALYHQGMDIVAQVNTGEDIWELRVRGQLLNKTWVNIGIRWDKPNLDETVVLDPAERGGLELYVNLEKVGHAVLPIQRADYTEADPDNGIDFFIGEWDVQEPVRIPKRDQTTGKIIVGEFEDGPSMTFGCHFDTLEDGLDISPGKFDHFHDAVLDEMAIWTRKLQINKTHDETLYFFGDYKKELEEMTPSKFAEILKAVNFEDPLQAEAAGEMTFKLLSNSKPEDEAAATTTTTTRPIIEVGEPSDLTLQEKEEKTWKEKERNKQLLLLDTYKELLSTKGVREGALPKHLDSRFKTIPIAAKLLSCDLKNNVRWKIVQEDQDHPGSSEVVKVLEDFATAYMGSANLSFYDDTEFFNATSGEFMANLITDDIFMSIQKLNMKNLRWRGQNGKFDTQIYRQPTRIWDRALDLWDNPRDAIFIPTEMWAESALCHDNPITLLYAIYPCYGEFAPLRRNPVEITSQKFVLDSKVISVRVIVNNDTIDPQSGEAALCKTDPQWMKYHPVQIRFFHKSKETVRRKIMHHEDQVKTSIDARRCVIWNEEIGLNGAWDARGCTTVMNEQDSTLCECDRFGTYALAAEKIEQPIAKDAFSWLVISRYIGFVISLLSLTIFVVVIMLSKHLWEMFHLMRLNTGICYWFALLFHFISEAKVIQEDRHSNTAISSIILFFYLSGSYFQLMEAYAEFRAITAGIIGGKTLCYVAIGWGTGFIGLGVTWFLYGNDIGTDPDVFIGWENETKMPFFYMNWAALWTALVLSGVVLFNTSTPQTRKEDVVEDLQVQGQGLAITNFLFCMVWVFAYPAYIKFPGTEMRDYYPVFTLFNAWMGFIIFIFLGLSSKRFRFVLSKWWETAKNAKWERKKKKYSPKPKPSLEVVEEDVVSIAPSVFSRPLSARTTSSQVSYDQVEDLDVEANLPETEDVPVEDLVVPLEDDMQESENEQNEEIEDEGGMEDDDMAEDDMEDEEPQVQEIAEASDPQEDNMDDGMEDDMGDDMDDDMDGEEEAPSVDTQSPENEEEPKDDEMDMEDDMD